MSFTRSASGVANYKLFFSADFVVFIEGKKEHDPSDQGLLADEVFYLALFNKIFPNQKVKIKCVGNCDDVVAHVRALDSAGIQGGFGIIDRDAEGILYSALSFNKRTMITSGYSWENDFWSKNTITMTVDRLVLAKEGALDSLRPAFSRGMSRLAFLCRLDFSTRIHGAALIKKNKKSCGINISGASNWGISHAEIRRFVSRYKSMDSCTCDISKSILQSTINTPQDRLVQGHLKQSLACNVIAAIYQSIHKKNSVSHKTIFNAALNLFREDPRRCMDATTFEYYEINLKAMIT